MPVVVPVVSQENENNTTKEGEEASQVPYSDLFASWSFRTWQQAYIPSTYVGRKTPRVLPMQ